MAISREIKTDQGALNQLPEEEGEFVERYYYPVLQNVHLMYLAQTSHGFYPKNLSRRELFEAGSSNESLLSPYTLVRREQNGQLIAVPYIAVDPYKNILPEISDQMDEAADYAMRKKLSDHDLIAASLRSRSQAFRRGDLKAVMVSHLNSAKLPDLDIFLGLDDRYLDNLANLKLSFEGWVTKRDIPLTCYFDKLVQSAISISRKTSSAMSPTVKVIVGDSIVSGGLASHKVWNGNTIPSEDDIRTNIGSVSYVFPNNFSKKFEEELKQAVIDHAPQITDKPGWEAKMKKAFMLDLIMHEVIGHGQVEFGKDAEDDLKQDYTVIKELIAEVGGQFAVLTEPANLLSREMKEYVCYASLVWSMKDVISEQSERGSQRIVAGTYARSGMMGLNFLERRRAIRISDKNTVEIPDLNDYQKHIADFLSQIQGAVSDARYSKSVARNFVLLNTTQPRSHFGTTSSQEALAS